MSTNFEKVKEFMTCMEQKVNSNPIIPTDKERTLRLNLILEEVEEYKAAHNLLNDLLESIKIYTEGKSFYENEKDFYKDIFDRKNGISKNLNELYNKIINYELIDFINDINLKDFKLNFLEYTAAIKRKLLIELGDAMTDILVVVYGAGHTYGLNLDNSFEEVHKSNMSKLDENNKPIKRKEDGKIMKGPNYKPPSLENIFYN